MSLRAALLAVASQPCLAASSESRHAANPIRKVVNLLQSLQKKVDAEAAKADELFEAFMCYCSSSGGDLQASIEAAEAKIPELAAAMEAATSKKKQLQSDLKSHKEDRRGAKTAMDEATALREKEKAAFDKAHADITANLAALKKATVAIEKGMEGSFLQTGAADVLRRLVGASDSLLNGDRQTLFSFLAGGQSGEYAPASGEITGILKQMGDTMAADEKDMVAVETKAVNDYESLMTAKTKEVNILSKSIETKTARVGELGVEIATMQADAGDTAESLEEDKKFAKDMKKNCATKEDIHKEEQSVRAQEVVALADTIKILNDDDALDLFKKTIPSSSSSFLQVFRTGASMLAQARELLGAVRTSDKHRLDFILLALRGKAVGFEKIVKLIDQLVVTLKKEQGDDDDQKEYCDQQIDTTEDKIKGLKQTVSDLGTMLAESKEGVATLTEEIKSLKAGIVALDKQVEEATAQRKAEAAEHRDLMKSDTAATEVILFAKNRLNKFYNPKLYKAPPKRELSEGDQIYENQGGDIPTEAPGGIANTGISAFVQVSDSREAPPPPPATAAAYTKKAEESNGVIAMMDLLVKDLDKEMTVAETEEKNAQSEYEETIADAAEKRRQDSRSLTDKDAAKADLEGAIENGKAEKKATLKDLMGVEKVLADLHGECDWLLKYYEVRKEARADEIDSLGKAKAVLSGADYSLLQHASGHKVLRRA